MLFPLSFNIQVGKLRWNCFFTKTIEQISNLDDSCLSSFTRFTLPTKNCGGKGLEGSQMGIAYMEAFFSGLDRTTPL